MVLKRPFFSDTRESPEKQRSVSLYDSFTQGAVLKRQFISDIYVQYSRHTYANNGKFMLASVPGHIADCSGSI